MAGIALFGVIAYRALPVSDLPQVDYPTITVSASLPGGNPDTMASSVATPLERQFTTIAGLDSMISTSSQGNSNITLQFSLDRDIDGATWTWRLPSPRRCRYCRPACPPRLRFTR